MDKKPIDGLLVRYLGLLDEYTRLRASLSAHQTALYGHLSRANFTAERGFRYGPDHFDGRMQAVVRLTLSALAGEPNDGHGGTLYSISRPEEARVAEEAKETKETKETEQEAEKEDEPGEEEKEGKSMDTNRTNRTNRAKTSKKAQPPKDPLQWFGVLTPMALRQAQQEAIVAVDTIVPRLATISSEMEAVEIAVQRARKKRARAAETTAATTAKQDTGSAQADMVPAQTRDNKAP